ncbi:MAG: cold-shock protein [Dehalococcoidia bacterium]
MIVNYGTVKWFDAERGVGVILADCGGREVMVSASDIDGGGQQSLRASARVGFTLFDAPRGARALRVWAL